MGEKRTKKEIEGSLTMAANLKAIRLLKKYTQEYMAEQLGISQADYSMLERGIVTLSAFRLFEIGIILNVDVYLMQDFTSTSLLRPPPHNPYK